MKSSKKTQRIIEYPNNNILLALKTQHVALPIKLRKQKGEEVKLTPESVALVLPVSSETEPEKSGKKVAPKRSEK